ncbi:MAG: alpha/beta hydrolase, partial [Pseudomonadota bacterium]|nr:alpha/beta hydrolase [Pseudomonadota bacterium]
MTTQEQTRAASEESRDAEVWRSRPPAGASARERLLVGMPVTERRRRLIGVSTAVLEGGDGPPLILLHGPGGYAAHWMRVIPGLVATHR